MLALLVGACFLLAWVIRLGWLADYFSRPVLVGYIHGVAIVLVCGQLGKLLGIDIDATEPIGQVADVLGALGDVSGATILVSAIALGALIAARFFLPRLPASLIVVVAAIAFSWAFDLEQHGVAVVGEIPSGLPSVTIPSPPLGDVASLLPAAIGIFLVSFADGILTARTFAGKNNQHVRANQELLAFSGMSTAAGITQGLPLGASGSRTAVNDQMGARTQIAGLVAAGAIALVLLFLTTPMSYLPYAVLGAVIVSAAIGLVDPNAWRGLAAVSRFEVGLGSRQRLGLSPSASSRRSLSPSHFPSSTSSAQRESARRRARLGRSTRSLRERGAPSLGARDSGCRRLPAGRPPLLRQRPLRQGPRARGGSWSVGAGPLARLRCPGREPCRLHRSRDARTT